MGVGFKGDCDSNQTAPNKCQRTLCMHDRHRHQQLIKFPKNWTWSSLIMSMSVMSVTPDQAWPSVGFFRWSSVAWDWRQLGMPVTSIGENHGFKTQRVLVRAAPPSLPLSIRSFYTYVMIKTRAFFIGVILGMVLIAQKCQALVDATKASCVPFHHQSVHPSIHPVSSSSLL